MAAMTEEELQAYWASLGYKPQIFPFYNAMGSTRFIANGVPNAVAGAQTTLSYSIDTLPIMAIGIRIEVFWQIPNAPTADEIALIEMVKRVVDPAMLVSVNFTSQNLTSKPIPVSHLMGEGGYVWHNFPSPYPMSGNKNIELNFERITSYPMLDDVRIDPVIYATLITQQMRTDKIGPAHRREMPR